MLNKLKHLAHVIIANDAKIRLCVLLIINVSIAIEIPFEIILVFYGLYIAKKINVSLWVVIFSLFGHLTILMMSPIFWRLLLTVFIVGFDFNKFPPIFTNAGTKLESTMRVKKFSFLFL